MQHANSEDQKTRIRRFSTLYGSKWVATYPYGADPSALLGFSTLYGSKWVATLTFYVHDARKDVFQYPLRVEVGCNARLADS